MFTKTIIKQGEKIIELDRENKKLREENQQLINENGELYRENKENRWDLSELQDYRKKIENLHDEIIMDLLDLQKINRLGIAETEKNQRRNTIINEIIKELDVAKTY